MDSNLTMKFYRVDRQTAAHPTFESCLNTIFEKQEEERELAIADTVMSILSTDMDSKKTYWGDLVRLQNENLPTLVQQGKVSPLGLPVGAHLGHHTAFMYDGTSGILGFQLARSSVSLSGLNLYIGKFCGADPYQFTPVIKASELKALASMRPKTFVIKVADPVDLEAIEDDEKELRASLIALQGHMNGSYVKIQVGMGNVKGDLNRGLLRSTIGWLIEQKGRKRGGVKTVQLEGKKDDGSYAPSLDFLGAHLGNSETLVFSGLSPRQNFQERLKFLRRAFQNRSSELAAFAKAI